MRRLLNLLLLALGGPTWAQAPRAAGQVAEHTLFDSTFARPRRVWVYTPPGYDARRAAAYPLLVAFDGDDYRSDSMPLPRVLDSLLVAKAAPAFVAVLVDDSSAAVRIADLANAPRMVAFLTRQLVPWVRRGWRVTSDPRRVLVTGASAGGLAAAYVALTAPETFGNVWAQSGAYWRGPNGANGPPWEWLTSQVAARPRVPVRFALDVGALESQGVLGGVGPSILAASRRFRDALQAKGYDVIYAEVPDGRHAPAWWRPRLPVGIVTLTRGW